MGDRIIGAEEGLKTVMERVALVAASDAPVLIYGETGTGKELIARTIHTGSSCADGPFIRVNCGAIPPELIDSQLFGHEKGAFTHAVETRKGWFEKADGGTLFLDEVGEMPLDAQVRLLRVLQDGWLERVGGKHPIRVSVRIVLATHRDLVTMVAEGTFREDLYYRISAFPIFLPALRDRLQDMRALAAHFAERSAIRFSLPPVMPTDKDIELLCRYHWPGNIRELGTVIDRAALLGNGASLNIAEAFGWAGDRAVNGTLPGKGEAAAADAKTIAPLDDIIAAHIRAALRRTGGRIDGPDGCARLLAVNPHTLRARMRKLEIDWRAFRTGRH
ncbi:sigma-54-dependent Fis family transcriptional regulator [bacterium]|nr:sigma-54-dependent Fis family transcriptional regulator [bacterium]